MGFVGVRFSESLETLITAEAKSSKKTKSDVIRTAVCHYFGTEDQDCTVVLLKEPELEDRIKQVVSQALEEKSKPVARPKKKIALRLQKT